MSKYFNHRISLTLFLITVFSICLLPKSADALTLSPTRFELSGDPGETITQEITLINESDSAQNYYSSYSNFEAQGESGTPTFVESKDDLDKWMSTYSVVSIKAGESISVPLTIKIPTNAEPGGHFASVFWGTTPSSPSGSVVSVGAKVGVLILLSVNGDTTEAGGLVSFSVVDKQFWHATLPVSFEYRFKNDGGDRVKPTGTIKIRDTIFLPTKTLDANPSSGNVLPGSTRKFSIDWINYSHPEGQSEPTKAIGKFLYDVKYQWKNFAVGLYSARLNVVYGSQGVHSKDTVFFFVFPWQLVVVMLLVITITFFGGRKMIRRYNRSIIKKAQKNLDNGQTV